MHHRSAHRGHLRSEYAGEGQIKEAFWGSSNYRLSYDSRRRLRTAEIGSTLNTLVFDYQNPTLSHLLTEISVSGVGTYRLVYKHDPLTGENGLSHIITPLGLYRTFSLFTSLGVERLTFFPWALDAGSTNAAAFTFDWETRIPPSAAFHGYPLARFTWPSGRRVNHLLAKRLIVYDNVQIHWDREELTDSTSVSLQDAINEFQIDEKRQFSAGTLVTYVRGDLSLAGTRRVDSAGGKLLAYSYEYEYDQSFLTAFLSVKESKRQEVIINVTFEYSGDGLLPSDMSLETIEDVPMRTHYRRGPGGRIEGIDCEVIGSSRRRHVQVVYNEESRVSDIRHYISDSQFAKAGNSESKHISTKFVYERGLLAGFGNWKYVFDENGCLIERRLRDSRSIEDLFEYNSKGLLRWVERRVMPSSADEAQLKQKQQSVSDDPLCNGLESACYHQEIGLVMDYAVQFLYDAEDRLVVVRNTLAINDMIQFFYAHPQHRNRLTSFFHHGKGKAYFLTYEQKTGHLFAIEEVDLSVIGDSNSERKLYIVITDTEGSPIALYADEKILWTAEYSATGGRRLVNGGFLNASLLDDFTVPLGYRGALMDLHTGFLFHTPTWQAYDPIGATLTSPDWRRVATSRLQRLHSHPQALDLHTWFSESSDLDPLARLQQAMQGPAWWLRGLDSGINRLFSHLQVETGAVSASSMEGEYNHLPTKCNQGLVITSRRLQQARHINDQLEQLGIVDTTRLASNKAFGAWFDAVCPIARIKTTPPVFGVNVSFSLSSDGTISVSRSENNVSLIRIARVLFSGAKLMDSWYLPIPSHGGMAAVTSFVQLFVKVAPSLNTDLQTLQLQRSALLSQTPIRLGGSVSPLSGVMVSLDNSAGTELRISSAVSPGVEWRLRYEENWTVASGRVLQEARSRGIDGAQRRAALIAGNSVRGPRTSPKPWPPWLSTSAEMRQMESEGGVVKGFVWKPVIREPKKAAVLTELLDDPAMYQLRPVNEKSVSNEN
ncbi:Teneurin-2 [Echinococcus granulosus]|uniref:Teneurin-2 n=1 Tax=Echinococcus granulosus TaxID=6210 RepID=W6U852_ECHGR|nr:Teneurin-2 [Echinococcus granulosus]EUB56536.1 Teneurin-2 [Echinococcus granulosus]